MGPENIIHYPYIVVAWLHGHFPIVPSMSTALILISILSHQKKQNREKWSLCLLAIISESVNIKWVYLIRTLVK